MKPLLIPLLLTLALPLHAHAESSASSAVSDSASSATSSASDSIGNSSKSSSGDKKVAAGEYRVLQLAAVPDHPGMLRAQLRNEAGEFALTLPAVAAERGGLAEGGMVNVMARPYGYAFTRPGSEEAFFLVLDDDWHRELRSRPVIL